MTRVLAEKLQFPCGLLLLQLVKAGKYQDVYIRFQSLIGFSLLQPKSPSSCSRWMRSFNPPLAFRYLNSRGRTSTPHFSSFNPLTAFPYCNAIKNNPD